MVKVIKKQKPKKKRSVNFENIIALVFLLSFAAYLGSITILRSYNVVLASEEKSLQDEIEKTRNDVANLEFEVKKLDNREYILNIAEEQGLKINQESIVSVASNE